METMIQKVLLDIAIALLGLGAAYAVLYINKLTAKVKEETAKIKDDKQRKLVQDALDRVNDLVVKTVGQIEQTTAKDLRIAVADGKVSKDELLKLGQQACDDVYSQLSSDTKTVLETEITDVSAYIKDAVENAVLNIKK